MPFINFTRVRILIWLYSGVVENICHIYSFQSVINHVRKYTIFLGVKFCVLTRFANCKIINENKTSMKIKGIVGYSCYVSL